MFEQEGKREMVLLLSGGVNDCGVTSKCFALKMSGVNRR